MKFTATPLSGSYVIEPQPFSDDRGWFVRTYCKNEFQQIGHTKEWVQINHSFTAKKGTIRGMHFQYPPFTEIKMLRCIAGAVYDVIVDLRNGSSTFLQSFSIELSAGNKKMLYIPDGFAHGFQTITENAELIYHHSAFYEPGQEGGLKYDDPKLDIQWPLPVTKISSRDNNHQFITEDFTGVSI